MEQLVRASQEESQQPQAVPEQRRVLQASLRPSVVLAVVKERSH